VKPLRATSSAREGLLPCPGVAFGADYLVRLERLTLRLSAARLRREGGGGARLSGTGEEFVGYRPYRLGEDLRRLDWDLFARLDRPYVRVTRREAAEHWSIHVDASASMGVGPPGKLQAAAELAGAVAALGLRGRAQVRTVVGAGPTGGELVTRRLTDLPELLAFLAGRRAGGAAGLALSLRERPPHSGAGRVFLLGDLLDVAPAQIARCGGRGRELVLAQILAPLELAPPRAGAVEWLDPEGEGRARVELDDARVRAYERALEVRLEAWSRFAASHGIAYGCFSSARPFEEPARALLRG